MIIHSANYWVRHLQLHPHPEGGYYKEVFRSRRQVVRQPADGIRKALTSIYYLLEGNDFSGFHRIVSDEVWYFHTGMPLHIHIIDEQGTLTTHELSDTDTGDLSVVVEGAQWFATEIPAGDGFALVSCAVAPGFEFSEFKMARRDDMMASFPQHAGLLTRLCRL